MAQAGNNLRMESIPLERLHDHPDNDYPTSESELADLMASIRSDGLAQLPLVRPHGDGYQIIAGHRRVECYRRLAREDPASYGTIPCNVATDCDDERALILLDATNLMTRQLTPAERARRFERLWKAVPALRKKSPELRGVRTSQVISDIITRETGQPISRASVDRAMAAGRRAKEVAELADRRSDELAPEWRKEIRRREGFTPEAVNAIAGKDESAQHTLWADYQREQMTPRQLERSLERKAPKTDRDVDQALDQVTKLLRDVSAWNAKYGAEVSAYRLDYIRRQLDKLQALL
ncbi:MAG: ParB N-terminal domain-containing protein [Atopobiaceae bacterium]|nr:ParB N-terminal domain-containing protein [Atopobiaceae bacterium]